MFFCFHRTPADNQPCRIIEDSGRGRPVQVDRNVLYLHPGKQRVTRYHAEDKVELWIMGDPVGQLTSGRLPVTAAGDIDLERLYEQIPGHYYWFLVSEHHFSCGSSFGAIYPVYYYREGQEGWVSSSSLFLSEQLHLTADDRRNLLERLVFNYPLFDSTWWSAIKLLPAQARWEWRGMEWSIKKGLDVSQYLGQPEYSDKSHLDRLVQQFMDGCQSFFPGEKFGISFTGGFDGRTLVGVARHQNQSFFAYSFGESRSTDILFPQAQSEALGIDYQPIVLDDEYLVQHAVGSARQFMELSEYNGNIGRPHYLYSAVALSERTDYMVTGNFGSELFRALHLPGMMMTSQLLDVFSSPDSAWQERLKAKVRAWSGEVYLRECDELIEDLYEYLQNSGLKGNQRFYRFVYEELFRKYFGPEMLVQSAFLNNRTPFLNYSFIRELNQTIWSGVHRPLFEDKRYKRMVGQYFYAKVLQAADAQLYRLPTTKGYAPADVNETWRKPLLLARFLQHRFSKNDQCDGNLMNEFVPLFSTENPALPLPGIVRKEKSMTRSEYINWLSIAYGYAGTRQYQFV